MLGVLDISRIFVYFGGGGVRSFNLRFFEEEKVVRWKG